MCTYVGQTSCRPSSPETQRWWSPTCDVNKIKKTLNVYKILVIDRILKRYFSWISQTPWWSRPRCSASVGPCRCCSPSSAWERHWETICGPDMIKTFMSFVKYFFVKNMSWTISLRKWPGHRGQDHCSWCSLREKWSESLFGMIRFS